MTRPNRRKKFAFLMLSWGLWLLVGCQDGCEPDWLIRLVLPKPTPLKGVLAEQIERGQREGKGRFSHAAYDALLHTFVNPQTGRVNYSGLKQKRTALQAYLKQLATADLAKLSRDQQLALLLNAYNAFTLSLIIEHYPKISSIREVSKPWARPRYQLAGQTLSLSDLENHIIRPLYRDPRIHFALNCASIGCPRLAAFAYKGETLHAQLDAVTRRTLRDPHYVRIQNGRLHLTRILSWYREDFSTPGFYKAKKTVAAYVAQYTTPTIRAFIHKYHGAPPIQNIPYDWKLNQQHP